MKSELSTFLDTIDTPEFRRVNLTKVRAKAADAQRGSGLVLVAAPLAGLGLTGAHYPMPSRSGE